MTPCLGGWCARRGQCPHYHRQGQTPEERLCLAGRDGVRLVESEPFRVIAIDVFSGRQVSAEEDAA